MSPLIVNRLGPAFLLLALLGGCASYSRSFQVIERELAAQRPEAALKALEARRYPTRDAVLHFLDRAMLYRMTGDYRASNADFETAKGLIERLTALSITEQGASLLINDSTRSYVGEPFEQVMIHLFAALNYLQLGELESARVEALQVDLRLRELAHASPDNPFSLDPFARYLSALIYEERREWSDALIAYRKALEAYQSHARRYPLALPEDLKAALLRLTDFFGLDEEHDRYQKRFPQTRWIPVRELERQGEVVVLLLNGLAPIKREQSVLQPGPKGQLVRISLPYYQRRLSHIAAARLETGGQSVRSEPVERIGAIAEATLQAHMPAITARAIARVVAKHNLSREAGRNDKMAGLLTNLAGVLTETADTRSWLTLPGEIQLARLVLPSGHYDITLVLEDRYGGTGLRREFRDIAVKAGRKRYLSHYWIDPTTPARH